MQSKTFGPSNEMSIVKIDCPFNDICKKCVIQCKVHYENSQRNDTKKCQKHTTSPRYMRAFI